MKKDLVIVFLKQILGTFFFYSVKKIKLNGGEWILLVTLSGYNIRVHTLTVFEGNMRFVLTETKLLPKAVRRKETV